MTTWLGRLAVLFLISIVIVLCVPPFQASAQSGTGTPSGYDRKEFMIPVRDGIRLYTVVFAPKDQQESLPFLLQRTPYGVEHIFPPDKRTYVKDLAAEGYIFVCQDIRGRYRSEGTFEMQRFSRDRRNRNSIDESTDTYDAIEWLLKNIPNNKARVGVLGVSYDGWLTVMATLDPHPALKAVSEQATPSDMFLGDDFHHNGAFRLSYGFEYAFSEEASKVDTLFPFGTYDTYEWYLKLGPLSHVNEKYFHGTIPTWNDFVNHPNYDEFWKKQSLPYRLDAPTVPTMHVAGWWDQEDFYGPMKAYEALEKKDSKHLNYLVVGPWNHGGWSRSEGRKLGNVSFDTATSRTYRELIQAPWFAYWLKDKGKGDFPEARTFRTGSNEWKSYDAWPPKNDVTLKNLYFHVNAKLSFEAPQTEDVAAFDSYLSDPAHPVPYRSRPIEETYGPGSRWYTWLTEDQRFVHMRPDVLSWETETLADDVTVTGDLVAHLFASTTGTDSDWIVKLIDVYPEQEPKDRTMGGYQLMIANEVMRGRFRKSFENPEPIKPGEVFEFVVDIHHNDHTFLKGHKIMVQVQSTWFPIIDRNPQKYVDNIFLAKDTDFQAATQRVYRSKRFPSYIALPITNK
ncbi:MAG: CocE/NonD family hydrolase [Ignavibacteriales bacterium]|nr:CocE/NonD family hydrolase [Ignavibacteriales bacterium]